MRKMKIMKWFKNNWFNILAALILLFALGNHPYSYFQILRWVVCAMASYNCYILYNGKGHKVWPWIFGIVAVLFNPIIPFYFSKSTWQLLDLIGGIIFVIWISLNSKKTKI